MNGTAYPHCSIAPIGGTYNNTSLTAGIRVEYWDGNSFVPVKNAIGLGLANNQYNTTRFDEITTTRLAGTGLS